MKYKKDIMELLEKIDHGRFLKMVYGFVKTLYEEKAEE